MLAAWSALAACMQFSCYVVQILALTLSEKEKARQSGKRNGSELRGPHPNSSSITITSLSGVGRTRQNSQQRRLFSHISWGTSWIASAGQGPPCSHGPCRHLPREASARTGVGGSGVAGCSSGARSDGPSRAAGRLPVHCAVLVTRCRVGGYAMVPGLVAQFPGAVRRIDRQGFST
jgi:hypothetical protein